MSRYAELIACWKKDYVPGDVERKERCTIMDENTTWEGYRYWEYADSGERLYGMPVSTQFLLCAEHESKEGRAE